MKYVIDLFFAIPDISKDNPELWLVDDRLIEYVLMECA